MLTDFSRAFEARMSGKQQDLESLRGMYNAEPHMRPSLHNQISELSLLDDQQQARVQAFLEHCCDTYASYRLKAGEFVECLTWLDQLQHSQQQQVITYMASNPLDAEGKAILNWYKNDRRFRLERTIIPVLSR